jgi:DNA-binding response OmpR family regulator
MHILIIDDDEHKVNHLSRALEGHTFDTAKSYIAGVKKLMATTYDGLILDMGFPLRDDDYHIESDQGLNVLREMQRRKIITPVMVYSGNTFDVTLYDNVVHYVKADLSVSVRSDVKTFLDAIPKMIYPVEKTH